MTRFSRVTLGAVAIGVVAAACGPAVLRDQHGVNWTTGGQVVYMVNNAETLSGVAVTLTAPDGTTHTATTGSAGLWTIKGLRPDLYAAHYELAGYEPVDGVVDLSASGNNQVSDPFQSAGVVQMQETLLTATVSPFNLTVKDGDILHDGLGGTTAVYGVAAGGAITVTFPRRVENFGNVDLRDGITQQNIQANLDSNGTTFTFSKTAIDNMNNGNTPLTPDNDPFTWHRIRIQGVTSYSPIHGDPQQMTADIYFNATP